MKAAIWGAVACLLAGCSAEDRVSGPGEISFAGLTYDVRNGGTFLGLEQTQAASMPTTGTAEYEGIWRSAIRDDYRNGSVEIEVDFAAGTAEVEGSANFSGTPTGEGVVSFNKTAIIVANGFAGASLGLNPGDAVVTGTFYGSGANVAAGVASVVTATGNAATGAFITAKQ